MARVSRRRASTTETESMGSNFFNNVSEMLNKKLGDNTVVEMDSEVFKLSKVREYISTQCYGLDWAMHLPGVPVGRVICIRGDYMSGKSTLAQHLMAETQKQGGFAVLIDTEYAFDEKRAKAIGIDLNDDKWMLVQVNTVEKAVKAVRMIIENARQMQDEGNDQLVTIVWDSVGATATEAEMNAEFGEARPGLHARLISAALRQLTSELPKYRICLVLVNQEKAKVDFFSQGKDTTTMTAEKPIMFHSTVVLRPRHKMKLTNSKKEPTGIRVETEVRKNKHAAPFSKAEFIISFDDGIDSEASVLDIAYRQGLVKKTGAWYSYDGKKFYERDFGRVLKENPEILEDLEAIRTRDMTKAARDESADDDQAEPEETTDGADLEGDEPEGDD